MFCKLLYLGKELWKITLQSARPLKTGVSSEILVNLCLPKLFYWISDNFEVMGYASVSKNYRDTLQCTCYSVQKLTATAVARILINQRTVHLRLDFGSG